MKYILGALFMLGTLFFVHYHLGGKQTIAMHQWLDMLENGMGEVRLQLSDDGSGPRVKTEVIVDYPSAMNDNQRRAFVRGHNVAQSDRVTLRRYSDYSKLSVEVTSLVSVDNLKRTSDEAIDPAYYGVTVGWRVGPYMMRHCDDLLATIADKCKQKNIKIEPTTDPKLFSVQADYSILPKPQFNMPLSDMHRHERDLNYSAKITNAVGRGELPNVLMPVAQVMGKLDKVCDVVSEYLHRCAIHSIQVHEVAAENDPDLRYSVFQFDFVIPVNPQDPSPRHDNDERAKFKAIEGQIATHVLGAMQRR